MIIINSIGLKLTNKFNLNLIVTKSYFKNQFVAKRNKIQIHI